MFDNDRYKVWSFCSDQKASLGLKTGCTESGTIWQIFVKLRKRSIEALNGLIRKCAQNEKICENTLENLPLIPFCSDF